MSFVSFGMSPSELLRSGIRIYRRWLPFLLQFDIERIRRWKHPCLDHVQFAGCDVSGLQVTTTNLWMLQNHAFFVSASGIFFTDHPEFSRAAARYHPGFRSWTCGNLGGNATWQPKAAAYGPDPTLSKPPCQQKTQDVWCRCCVFQGDQPLRH